MEEDAEFEGQSLGRPSSHRRGDVAPCVDERLARDLDHSFVRAATASSRQDARGGPGDVGSDDGEIAGGQFQDVGATVSS